MTLQSLFRSRRSPNARSTASARRLAAASATRRGGLERLEDRRMLAFQYQGISITSGPGDQESYQLHFQVFNESSGDPGTIYVRQNDVLGRLELDYSPTFSSLQSIPILTGTYPPSTSCPSDSAPGVVGPGWLPYNATFIDAVWNGTETEDFHQAKLRVTCAPDTVAPTFVMQTGNTFRLSLEVDFSNAAPDSTGRVFINAPLADSIEPNETLLCSWLTSYEFKTNEIYIQAAVNPAQSNYFAAGPSPNYSQFSPPAPPQLPPTGLIQIENAVTGGLTALVSQGDFKIIAGASVSGTVSVQMGAGEPIGASKSARWGYGGTGGDIIIDGAIQGGSVLMQTNSLDPRRIVTGPSGVIAGGGSLNLYNMAGDGGTIDVRTSGFGVTNVFAGSPVYTSVPSGQVTDIGITVDQIAGNLVINALPSSRGAIALKATGPGAQIDLNANYATQGSLSMEASSLNIGRPLSSAYGSIGLVADTVTVSSNVFAGTQGVGDIAVTSRTGAITLANSAIMRAADDTIRLNAATTIVSSAAIESARLEAVAGQAITANTRVTSVTARAGGAISLTDGDGLIVEDVESTGSTVTINAGGPLTLERLRSGLGDAVATTSAGGLVAQDVSTAAGSARLTAGGGDVTVSGTIVIGDTGATKTNDMSITASTGNIYIENVASIVVPDQLVLSAVEGRVLTPGRITGVTIDSSGSDYTMAPDVVFSTGSGAIATPVVGDGQVTALRIVSGGTGFTTAPSIVFDNTGTGGSGASAIARVSNGALVGVTVTNPGWGYKVAPRIRVVGGSGANASVVAEINGIVAINASYPSGGESYLVPPTVVISSGDGAVSGAVAVGAGGSITGINVSQRGGGYNVAPTVNIVDSSGSGFGALAVANLSLGVTAVTLGAAGTGYTGATTVAFDPPPVGGIQATGSVSLGLTNASTTSIAGAGTGYATGDIVEAIAGTGARFRVNAVTVSGGVSTTEKPTILDSGRLYSLGDILYLSGTDGTGLELTVTQVDSGGRIINFDVTAQGANFAAGNVLGNVGGSGARFEVSAVGGQITSLRLVAAGKGYTNRPTTIVGGSGSGAVINFNSTEYQVVGVNVVDTGSGYASPSVGVTFGGSSGAGALASGITTSVVDSISVISAGTAYNPATTQVTLASPASGGGASSAPVTVDNTGAIHAINVSTGGAGYLAAPTITIIDDSGSGYGATATANVTDGVLVGFTITSSGYAYNPSTTRVVISPVGSGATAVANLTGGVLSLTVTIGGSGYDTNPPTVTIAGPTGGGVAATATAIVDATGAISGFVVTNPGSGYALDESPVVTITGGDGTADAIASVGNVVGSVRITNSGSGYIASATTVTFLAYGSGASATSAITPGGVTGFVINDGGSGYLSAPTVTIEGDGTGATAVATVSGGSVVSVRPVEFGQGYTSANVTLSGVSTGPAQATALVSGVTDVTILDGGSGYVAPTTVIFTLPAGTAHTGVTARGTAIVSDVAQIAAGRLSWTALEKPLSSLLDQFSTAKIVLTGAGDLDITRSFGDLTIEGAVTKDGSIRIAAQKLTIAGAVTAGDFNNTKTETVSLQSFGGDLFIDAPVVAPAAVTLVADAGSITSNVTPAGLITTKDLLVSALNGVSVRTKVNSIRGVASGTAAPITVTEVDDLILGTDAADLTSNNGVITVTAGGGLLVGRVAAGQTGSVVLTAETKIVESTPDAAADVVAQSASLTVNNGWVDIDTDVSTLAASALLSRIDIDNTGTSALTLSSVLARNSIRIGAVSDVLVTKVDSKLSNVSIATVGATSDITVNSATAAAGLVTLDAGGDVTGVTGSTSTNVTSTGARVKAGGKIALRTAVGSLGATAVDDITITELNAISLGESVAPLDFQHVLSNTGTVSITAGGLISALDVQSTLEDVVLNSTGDGVVLGSVSAVAGKALVTASKSITDTDPTVDLRAVRAEITSLTGTVGSSLDPIDFSVDELRVQASGDIRFTEENALLIDGLKSTKGDIVFAAGGDVTQTAGKLGAITGGLLSVRSSAGAVTLTNPENDVTSFSANNGTRPITYLDKTDLTIAGTGVVGGNAGDPNGDAISITATSLTVNQPITSGTAAQGDGDILLTATTGNIVVKANLVAKSDTITLKATKGTIVQQSSGIDCDTLVWYATTQPTLLATPVPNTYGVIAPHLTAAGNLTITGPATGLLTIAGASTVDGNITITGADIRITDLVSAGGTNKFIKITATTDDITFADDGQVANALGTVTLNAADGLIIAQNVLTNVITPTLTVSAMDGVYLASNVGQLAGTVTAGPLEITEEGALAIGGTGLTVSDRIQLTVGGAMTQTAAIKTAWLDIIGLGGPITLNKSNDVDSLSVDNGFYPIVFNDVDDLTIDPTGIQGGRTASSTALGVDIYAASIIVDGAITSGTAAAGDGDIRLTANGQASDILINADLTALNDRVILDASNGQIVQNGGAILCRTFVWYATTSPTLLGSPPNSFVIVAPNVTTPGDLDLVGPADGTLIVAGASTIDGNISIRSGSVTIIDLIQAGGTDKLVTVVAEAGDIVFDLDGRIRNLLGDVTLDALAGGQIVAVNIDSVTNVTAQYLDATAAGSIALSTAVDSVRAEAAGGDLTLQETDGLQIVGILAAATTLMTGGAVTQSGAIEAGALSIVNTAGSVTLTNAVNNVGTLSVLNGTRAVSFTDVDDLTVAAAGITGTPVTLVVGGGLSQDADAPITAATLFVNSGAGDVQLAAALNAVDTLAINGTTSTVTFRNAGSLAMTASSNLAIGDLGINVGGPQLSIQAANGVTQTGTITAAALSVTATGGAVTLAEDNVVDTLVIQNPGRSVTFTDVDGVAIGAGGLAGSTIVLKLGTQGSASELTQTGPITATTLDIASAGTISLTSPNNDVSRLIVDNSSQRVSFTDRNALSIESVGTLAVGTITASTLTVSTTSGGGVDVGPEPNALLKATGKLDLTGVQGAITLRNNGRIEGSPIVVKSGTAIQVNDDVTTVEALNQSVELVNSLPSIVGASYEIVVSQSLVLTQSLIFVKPVTLRGTSQAVTLAGTDTVRNGVILNASASGSRISAMTFANFKGEAIRLNNNTNTIISGIRVVDTTAGVTLSGTSTGTIVQGNTFDRNTVAIQLLSATGALVGGTGAGQGNTITSASRAGIFAKGFCTRSQVVKNVITKTKVPYDVKQSRNLRIVK